MSETTDRTELIAELVKLGNAVDEFTIGVPAELRAATALAQSERDLAAYRKAKAENDELFLNRALVAEEKLAEQGTTIEELRAQMTTDRSERRTQ